MRIDKFLWFARITKTRAQAAGLAEAGYARIDGRRIDRAHTPVASGHTLTLMIHDRVRVLRIDALPRRRGPPAEARACYSELGVDGPCAQS